MSDKARRSNAWDDQHLKGPLLWPVKAVLKALSSITLAVILLVLVMLYGISASVPVGLLALGPTYLAYALVFVVCVGLCGGLPALVVRRLMSESTVAKRFLASFGTLLVGGAAGAVVWAMWIWPMLRYDPGTHTGFRLFAEFVEANKAITVRRLPIVEMSELEYYAWWPMRAILLTFVVNMVVATVRRIEFNFKNIGVLTVHTGIVVIALGSVYYSGLKREGDTILLAGNPDPHTGKPGVGPVQDVFYDNTRVSLYINDNGITFNQRVLEGLPRYNDYGLDAITGESAWTVGRRPLPWDKKEQRELSIPVEGLEKSGLSFRVVGYSSYNEDEPRRDWVKRELPRAGAANPLALVYIHTNKPDDNGVVSDAPAFAFTLLPRSPVYRLSDNGVFSIEYTQGDVGMTESRWRALGEKLPEGARHALVVEVPGKDGKPPTRVVMPCQTGTAFGVGDTGYRVGVKKLEPQPPFPIITEGYKGATSSVAVLQITPPDGKAYERFVYHRFPEINQDILSELRDNGMPVRRDADPGIDVQLVEADAIYAYVNEKADGTLRAIVRQQGGEVKVFEPIAENGRFQLIQQVELRVGERWANAKEFPRPSPVPPEMQDKKFVGTHDRAMMAVEVTAKSRTGGPDYQEIVWLPFMRYLRHSGSEQWRAVDLPDGRQIKLGFGRTEHPFPGFALQLVDFEMLAYDHRGAPRDYQSVIRVTPDGADFEQYEHVTQLNAPLQAPFNWDNGKSWFWNLPRRLKAGMSPFQFKLSQASWDQEGWVEAQKLVDAGQLKRPFARWTGLGVGNNPGIHLIALGSVLMAVGIPWAFYLKPWLVKREKKRIQAAVAAGTWQRPVREPRERAVTVAAGRDANGK